MFSSRTKLQRLVEGYLRDKLMNSKDDHYEENLINIIIEYLLLKEYFSKLDTRDVKLDETQTKIEKTGGGFNTCYGLVKIPSLSQIQHHWRFKMINIHHFVAIGIDETKYLRISCGLFDFEDSKAYGVWSDGGTTHWAVHKADYKQYKYQNGDVVEMILDLKEKEIYVSVNEAEPILAVKDIDIGDEIEYCMAVTLSFASDCVQLLEYFQVYSL